MQCPDCKGIGTVFAFINRGPDISKHTSGHVNCAFCNGTGDVSIEKIKQREAGRSWFDAQGGTLRDIAKRYGMTMADVSKIRQGRAPIPGDR